MLMLDNAVRGWARYRLDGRYVVEATKAVAAFSNVELTEVVDLLSDANSGPVAYVLEMNGYLLIEPGTELHIHRTGDHQRFDLRLLGRSSVRAEVVGVLESFSVPAFAFRYSGWYDLTRSRDVALIGVTPTSHSWRLGLQIAHETAAPFFPSPQLDSISSSKIVSGPCVAAFGRVEVYNNDNVARTYTVSMRLNPFS
jgi:hypothetical protein